MFFACTSATLGCRESIAKGPKPPVVSSNERDETDPRLRTNVASRARPADTKLCVEVDGSGSLENDDDEEEEEWCLTGLPWRLRESALKWPLMV